MRIVPQLKFDQADLLNMIKQAFNQAQVNVDKFTIDEILPRKDIASGDWSMTIGVTPIAPAVNAEQTAMVDEALSTITPMNTAQVEQQ